MSTLATNFIVASNTVYLCYYDPQSNNLKELNPEEVKLILLPYQETIKRFYLVSKVFQANDLVRVTVTTDGSQKYSYKTKTLCGKNNPVYNHFDEATSSCAVLYNNVEKRWNNALPVDVWVQSLNKNESAVNLDISVSLDKKILD